MPTQSALSKRLEEMARQRAQQRTKTPVQTLSNQYVAQGDTKILANTKAAQDLFPPRTGGVQIPQTQDVNQEVFQRQAPVRASYDNPIVKTPLETPAVTEPTSATTDEDRLAEIMAKKYNNEPLTKDEIQFVFRQQFKPKTVETSDVLGDVGTQYQSQITDAQKTYDDAKTQLESQSKTQLQAKQDEINARLNQDVAVLQEQGRREEAALNKTLSFKGVARSTYAADKQMEIAQDISRRETILRRQAEMERQAYEAELNGATAETLKAYADNINSLKKDYANAQIEAAKKVAELNAESNVSIADAFENVSKILGDSTRAKVDATASKGLGYLVNEFGQPIDANGNVTQNENAVRFVNESAIKYSAVTDPYTGTTYFYDPQNPFGTFQAAPAYQTQSYVDSAGRTVSSPTTSVSNLMDANIPEQYKKYPDNCVYFAAQFVPNIPTNAKSIEGRRQGVEQAKLLGFGGTNPDEIKVGDAIHTTEGSVGHTAIVAGIQGNDLYLLEANYDGGRITEGRTISKYDPKIIGYIRPNANFAVDRNEPSFEPVSLQITQEYTPAEIQQFKNYPKKGVPDDIITGRSQAEKDAKKRAFITKYNTWAQSPEGKNSINQDIVQKIGADDRYKFITDIGTGLQETMKAYYDLIDKAGAVSSPFDSNRGKVRSTFANLKTDWKEVKNLGALTGPDLGLIEEAVPDITSSYGVGPALTKVFTATSKQTILDAVKNQYSLLQRKMLANLDALASIYPEYKDSDVFRLARDRAQRPLEAIAPLDNNLDAIFNP